MLLNIFKDLFYNLISVHQTEVPNSFNFSFFAIAIRLRGIFLMHTYFVHI